jgi:phospholipid transport system substrate-binding protein
MQKQALWTIGGSLAACIGLGGWTGARVENQRVADATPAVETVLAVTPDLLEKTISTEVLAILKRDYDEGNPSKVAELVEARILPFFDFPEMTKTAVALNWRHASLPQQQALTGEFKTLLVRTYSLALATYRERAVEYRPLRAKAGETDVTVRSIVRRAGLEPLAIDYDMAKTDAGWKVYDVKVAGVSLIISYRETFAAEVREHGVDGLIKMLSDKNKQNGR